MIVYIILRQIVHITIVISTTIVIYTIVISTYDGIMIKIQDNTNQILYLPVDDDEYEPFSPWHVPGDAPAPFPLTGVMSSYVLFCFENLPKM